LEKFLSFPLITELPRLLQSVSWAWESFLSIDGLHHFWLGTSPEGLRWLVKMKGSFLAYREHVAASLAQALGLSCQSSSYLVLTSDSPPIRAAQNSSHFQLALWLLPEHNAADCVTHCPVRHLTGSFTYQVLFARLRNSGVKHALDLIRSEILVYLCGATEPCGYIFTKSHEIVIIDNELMFAHKPTSPDLSPWFEEVTSDDLDELIGLTSDICERLASLSDRTIESFLSIPDGYVVEKHWPIRPLVYAAREEARRFLKRVEQRE
jgi:hypothetical protein